MPAKAALVSESFGTPSSARRQHFLNLVRSLCTEYELLSQECNALSTSKGLLPQDFQQVIVDLDDASATPVLPSEVWAVKPDMSLLPTPPLSNGSLETAKDNVSALETNKTAPPGDAVFALSQGEVPSQRGEDLQLEETPKKKEGSHPYRHHGSFDVVGQFDTNTSLNALQDQLTKEYTEKLREQFDLLDHDEDDRISLDQCYDMVGEFVGHELDKETFADTVRSLHAAEETKRKSCNKELQHTPTKDLSISFDDFLHLMGTANEDSEKDKLRLALRGAFDQAHVAAEALAKKAELSRKRHSCIALLLDIVPAIVILINAVVLGLRADYPKQDAVWNAFDIFFLVFYSGECVAKMCMFGCKVYCCGPEKGWNWFDIFCVMLSLIDNIVPMFTDDMTDMSDMMLLKMLRLLKLARLVKMVRYPIFAELKLMMLGVVGGLKVLLWALVLLLLVVYFIGVIMNNLVGKKYEEFNTVPAAMFTTFRCFTDGCTAYNGTPLQEPLRSEYGVIFLVPYVLVTMIVIFGLFNLIMAVFVDNATGNGTKRRQEKLGQLAADHRQRMQALFTNFIMHCKDGSHHGRRLLTRKEKEALRKQAEIDAEAGFHSLPETLAISSDIFAKWVKADGFLDMLDDSDIDSSNSWDLFEALDQDMDGRLSPGEIIEGLMRLRGPITKIDMVAMRMKIRYCLQLIQDMHKQICPDVDRAAKTADG